MNYKNDATLFKDAAWYYAKYRRGYPKFFYDHISRIFKLDKSSRALDLGTGTGQIAIPLSKIVKEVVAVDPDREMLNEGKSIAQSKGITNIIWLKSRAEDITKKLGHFNITTIGASFHWMEQDKVLSKVYQLTHDHGGVVLVSNTSSIHRNRGNDEWKDVVLKTIEKYLGKKRKAGKGYFNETKDKFEDILKRSEFKVLKPYNIRYVQEWDVKSIIGFLYSTSYASRRFFGDRIEEFENELRANLLKLNRSGKFTETAVLEALLGQKE
ncbi:MAG: methyltransferase domain-containing protein [Candidatus Buchananbacteria bacterium]|nr:methyltransferase domain-containing protein [Candidatus Buchananbacteria bacterium]